MPESKPLFILVPQNELSRELVVQPKYRRLHHYDERKNFWGIAVHCKTGGLRERELISFGRGPKPTFDIQESDISGLHCSFTVNKEATFILFHDHSKNRSSQIGDHGTPGFPFQNGRKHRRVVVEPEFNRKISFAGANYDRYAFSLNWVQNSREVRQSLRIAMEKGWYEPEDVDVTLEIPETIVLTSKSITEPSNMIRYFKNKFLGQGGVGSVYRVIDVDRAKLIAVKQIQYPTRQGSTPPHPESQNARFMREVDGMVTCQHDHIIEFLGTQHGGLENGHIEIFMELKDGSLDDLIRSLNDWMPGDLISIMNAVLQQMLKALQFIHSKGMIHRDVKPWNILYTSTQQQALKPYQFQLSDFGTCKSVDEGRTRAGTTLFMAPEVCRCEEQTSKIDIWSLFVTLIWIIDARKMRSRYANDLANAESDKRFKFIQSCRGGALEMYAGMAITDPKLRPSAAEIIASHFREEGQAGQYDHDVLMKDSVM